MKSSLGILVLKQNYRPHCPFGKAVGTVLIHTLAWKFRNNYNAILFEVGNWEVTEALTVCISVLQSNYRGVSTSMQ